MAEGPARCAGAVSRCPCLPKCTAHSVPLTARSFDISPEVVCFIMQHQRLLNSQSCRLNGVTRRCIPMKIMTHLCRAGRRPTPTTTPPPCSSLRRPGSTTSRARMHSAFDLWICTCHVAAIWQPHEHMYLLQPGRHPLRVAASGRTPQFNLRPSPCRYWRIKSQGLAHTVMFFQEGEPSSRI